MASWKTAALIGTTVAVASPLILTSVGFGAGGVVAGSVAAAGQSMIYGAYTGGIFSTLQSAGAIGIAIKMKAAVGVTSSVAVKALSRGRVPCRIPTVSTKAK